MMDAHRTPSLTLSKSKPGPHPVSPAKAAGEEKEPPCLTDRVIWNLTSKFTRLEGPKIEKGILEALRVLGESLRAARSFLCFPIGETRGLLEVYEWCRPGIDPKRPSWHGNSVEVLPWESNVFPQSKAESPSPSLLMPIYYGKSSAAFLGFEGLGERDAWPEETFAMLQAAGEILVNAWRQKKVERDLQETRQRFQELVAHSEEIIFSLDSRGLLTYLSRAVERSLQYTPAEMVGRPMAQWVHPPDLAKFRVGLEKSFTPGEDGPFEFRLLDRQGKERCMKVSAQPLLVDGQPVGLRGILSDITFLKLADVLLQRSELRYRSLFENAVEGIFQYSLEGRFLIANPACSRILGYRSPDELIQLGEECRNLCFADPGDYREFKQGLEERGVVEKYEIQLRTRDKGRVWVSLNVRAIPDPDGIPRFIEGRMEDITERKASEARIRHLSFHDKLTGLYNRAYFEEEVNRLDAPRQLPISLIQGDVNGLKLINDVFGHDEGDRLLRQIALILRESCRKEDIVAHLGGDEFAIFLPRTSADAAEEIVQRIKNLCAQRSIGPLQLSIALGAVTKESPSQNIGKILREAEEKMYQTKLSESKAIRSSLYFSLQKILYQKSYETEEHIQRIKDLALGIGSFLALPPGELQKLSLLATWHDIGMVAVPEAILRKTGGLTEEEMKEVWKHAEIGYRIAELSPELASISEAILSHHENWDGTGYPLKKKGEEIPLISRVLAIADAFEVMTHGRPHRKTLPPREALREIGQKAGLNFEPRLVEVFQRMAANDGDRESIP